MRVVITGSSSGIGRALTTRLLEAGHEVWGWARSDQADLAACHRERFHPVRCDVAQWSHVEAATGPLLAASHVDALVTCAAIHGGIGPATAADPITWSTTIRTILDGTYFAIRALWPALLRAPRRAKVVSFSGGGATKARPNFSAYGAAKCAIVRLIETIAEEERDAAVDLNSFAPGVLATRLTAEISAMGPAVVGADEFRSAEAVQSADDRALHRALACLEWLLSPESDGISGKLISAPWDPWHRLGEHRTDLDSDIYTLRRIVPSDRGKTWGNV